MIYRGHNATAPVQPDVFEAMRPYFWEEWGTPSPAGNQSGAPGHYAPEQRSSACDLPAVIAQHGEESKERGESRQENLIGRMSGSGPYG